MGLLPGTKPSKVAARLSLVDWLLVVLLGMVTSVSSSTIAVTGATVALVRVLIMGDVVACLVLWFEQGDSSLMAVSMSSAVNHSVMMASVREHWVHAGP